jgi:beta-galactosidase/beta-glucuronidase
MNAPNLSATEIREETNLAKKKSVNLLPRTVLRTNAHILLDGEWHFSPDPENEGLSKGWHLGHQYAHKANWPGSVEQHLADARGQSLGRAWEDKVVVWYERSFPLPSREDVNHQIFQLTFGACGYETRVWLNGYPLRTIEGEEVHYGEYSSFSYELSEEILQPVNRLTVRIADTMDAEIPRGKQESHVYKRGGIWYQTYTGAVRSVWLETVERNRLRSRVSVLSIVEDRLVRFNVTTRIHDAGDYVVRLKVYELEHQHDEPIATSDYPIQLAAGQKNQRLVLEIPGAKLWSPETPQLYMLVAQLISPDGYIAEIQTHFGLRKIEARGRYIYLNNKNVYLNGILYQPGTATYEQMKKHMLAIKKLGCNLVRVHIAGIDPRIYNLADEIGLLVWIEVPSPHSSTALSRKNHFEELQRMLAMTETNPSIIIWSLYNEDWGIQDVGSNADVRKYLIETYHYMRIYHPQYLIVDNDGWNHVSLEGKLKSDLLTAHIYITDLQKWNDALTRLTKGEMQGVAVQPLVIGDPFFYRGQVPIVISEWGGFGFKDYGGPEQMDERAQRIAEFKRALRNFPIAGDVYTQATNIEDERNGLMDDLTGETFVPDGILDSLS